MSSKTKTNDKKEDSKPAPVPKLRFPEFREAKHWSATTVGKISKTVIAGGTPSTSEKRFWGGEIRWMNSGELNDKKVSEVHGRITREGLNNSSTKVIPPRCVLIGLAGQGKTRGTVAMNLVELCTNQSIASIFPNNSAFNSEFLYHDLDRRYDELRRLSAGGEGRGGLNLQIIKSLMVLLPSLPEQQKIAECLSSADELIAAQARKLDALKTHKKGLMQQLFPRAGETQPRVRFPEFQHAGEWSSGSLGSLFETSSGGTPDRTKEEYWNGSIPWITTSLVSFNIITEADEFITDAGLNNSSAKVFPEKTILMAMYGQGKTRGQVAMLGIKASTNQACAAILPRQDIDPRFVFLNLGSRYEELRGLSNSGGQENLSQGLIQGLPFSYPKDQSEQQRIADCLTNLDDLITAQTQKLEALKTHKKGLMQQLFPSPEETNK
jgi:type I restriction enzyme S subunit